MTDSTAHRDYRGLARLKLFLALSRTPHGVLDMTTPAFGALLWLGTFPPAHITILGIITVFAGYTAVYALNDVIDYRVDREKARLAGTANPIPMLPWSGCDSRTTIWMPCSSVIRWHKAC